MQKAHGWNGLSVVCLCAYRYASATQTTPSPPLSRALCFRRYMFIGTEFQKWCALFVLALVGGAVANGFPHPSDPIRPYLLVLLSLMFAKHWLEYLLFLPIIGLKGLYIPTQEREKRRNFFIFTLVAYVALMVWLVIYVYPA